MNCTERDQEISRIQLEHDRMRELCNIAGCSHRFGEFLDRDLTLDQVSMECLNYALEQRRLYPERFPTATQATPRPAPVVATPASITKMVNNATPAAVVTMRAATHRQPRIETLAEWLASPLRTRLEAFVAEHNANEAAFDAKRQQRAAKAPAIRLHLLRRGG